MTGLPKTLLRRFRRVNNGEPSAGMHFQRALGQPIADRSHCMLVLELRSSPSTNLNQHNNAYLLPDLLGVAGLTWGIGVVVLVIGN
jgi:hypothetical protein